VPTHLPGLPCGCLLQRPSRPWASPGTVVPAPCSLMLLHCCGWYLPGLRCCSSSLSAVHCAMVSSSSGGGSGGWLSGSPSWTPMAGTKRMG
jgi:hypothetical protein